MLPRGLPVHDGSRICLRARQALVLLRGLPVHDSDVPPSEAGSGAATCTTTIRLCSCGL
jgi:hypothetical protein